MRRIPALVNVWREGATMPNVGVVIRETMAGAGFLALQCLLPTVVDMQGRRLEERLVWCFPRGVRCPHLSVPRWEIP